MTIPNHTCVGKCIKAALPLVMLLGLALLAIVGAGVPGRAAARSDFASDAFCAQGTVRPKQLHVCISARRESSSSKPVDAPGATQLRHPTHFKARFRRVRAASTWQRLAISYGPIGPALAPVGPPNQVPISAHPLRVGCPSSCCSAAFSDRAPPQTLS